MSERKNTRVFGSLEEAMKAGALDPNDTGVQALLKKEKEMQEAEEIPTKNAAGEDVYKVLVIGDQASAKVMLEKNDRLSIGEHRDPALHSIDDICEHIAGVINTPRQYDAVVFCHREGAEPAYLREFCRDHGLGLSGRYGMVTVYAGPLELEEVTKIARDKIFAFDPAQVAGMDFLAQNLLVSAIEEGKEYMENFKPATVVIANGNSELAYMDVMKRGYVVCAYPPTKEGCASAWRLLSAPTSDIGVVVVDVADGLTEPAELILDAAVNDYPATRRVLVGKPPSGLEAFRGYLPFTHYDTHRSAAGGLLRLVEGYNPEIKPEAVTDGPVKIVEGDTVKLYKGDLKRPTSMRRKFADE